MAPPTGTGVPIPEKMEEEVEERREGNNTLQRHCAIRETKTAAMLHAKTERERVAILREYRMTADQTMISHADLSKIFYTSRSDR